MERIRILLAEMPPLLRDVFREVVTEQSDMEIVQELESDVGLLLAVGQCRAHVVILGLEDAELPGVCTHLFEEYPHIRILGVTADGRSAFLYELRPDKVPIGEVSAQGLLNAIRAAVQT